MKSDWRDRSLAIPVTVICAMVCSFALFLFHVFNEAQKRSAFQRTPVDWSHPRKF